MTAIIQSIQPFSITVSTATSSGTAAITAVNTSMAVIFPNGVRGSGGNATTYQTLSWELQLTSSVLVTSLRPSGSSTNVVIHGTVVEFANFVGSIQTGTITATTGTTGTTAAINAVSSRAFVIYQGAGHTQLSSYASAQAGITMVSSVELRVVHGVRTEAYRVRYAVVDLTSDLVESAQQIDLSAATTSTADVATIASIDPGRSLLIDGGQATTGAPGGVSGNGFTAHIAGATSVAFIRASSVGTDHRRHFATVVQFQAQAFASTVQRGVIDATSASSVATSTIAAVTTRAHINAPFVQGRASSNNTVASQGVSLALASTLVTLQRASTANSVQCRYEVAEWASSINLGGVTTSVGSGLIYGNLLSGHVRSPVNRANYIMQGSA
jgi:hypothetical protein